ncbi:MAG: winged helix-turn-helix domain-containing tetratricopeptide repeat protein [Neptuniibacter sp.]
MRYLFNEFTLDTERGELSRQGEPVHSEPQVIELLSLLVKHHDRTVSKEEILNEIWAGRVVSEAALSSRIKSLRQVLGDDGRTQQTIRTVHKRGFRFVVAVEVEESASGADESSAGENSLTGHVTDNPAVVVLPFANLSDEAEQQYLSDGLTTDIIAHLSKHRWLDVVARNTAFGYRGKSVDVCQLGHDLDVEYLVEGSVQSSGQRVRITVNLIHTKNGHGVWTERFDRVLEDIFELQDEITEKIVARLEPEIGYAERNRVVRARPQNLQAWDCFHLGVYHFYKFTGPDNVEAQRLLRQSWEMDKQFGDAYVWWAYSLVLGMVYWNTKPTDEHLDEALQACDKAISLDRQNAMYCALRARVRLARCEYDLAIAENNRAIELNPTLALAHCALGDSLAYEGRYEESLACFEKAISLSPNDPQLWAFYTYGALALIFKKDFDEALEWLDKARSIPNFQYWTNAHRAVVQIYLGRIDEAKQSILLVKKEVPEFSLDFVREKLFFIKDKQQVALYLEGIKGALKQ